jgi:hypothetical protein
MQALALSPLTRVNQKDEHDDSDECEDILLKNYLALGYPAMIGVQ